MKIKQTRMIVGFMLAFAVSWGLPKAWAKIDDTYKQIKLVVDILDLIKENYVEEPDSQKVVYGAAHGMVKTLDAFSQFMEPDLHKEIKTETEGEFGGLGIRLGIRDNWLTVITPIPGTPAFKAGVFPLDRIIKIEGESTKDLSLMEAVKKLRGKPNTKVAITIARPPDEEGGSWQELDISVTREVIKIETVQSRMLDGNVGYVRILEFSGHTTEDVAEALKKLDKKGMEALILDLRSNPGGLLNSAVDISRLFIDAGKMIVYTKGRKQENYQEFRAGSSASHTRVPMTVLVNNYSASGSEIVSGALQDHRRAVIIGMKTYGKASVQSVIPLTDGSGLRLTVAKYYTPSGKSIHRNEKTGEGGITPDIEVQVPRSMEAKIFQQMDRVYKPDGTSKSAVDEKEQVRDEILERAKELLRAREILSSLTPDKAP